MERSAPTLREKYHDLVDTNITLNDYAKAAGSGAFAIMGVDGYQTDNPQLMWSSIAFFIIAILMLRFEGQYKERGLAVIWEPWEVSAFVGNRPVAYCGNPVKHNPHAWVPTIESVTTEGRVWASTDEPESACLGHDCDDPSEHMK